MEKFYRFMFRFTFLFACLYPVGLFIAGAIQDQVYVNVDGISFNQKCANCGGTSLRIDGRNVHCLTCDAYLRPASPTEFER